MQAGRQDSSTGSAVFGLEQQAHGLAEHLPDLILEALRVANTISHGIHGRRRAGPGETFWQFRHYEFGDSIRQIDWRRSASSDQHYVREREWEAAHTVWLWPDLSPSMDFLSTLASQSKRDRALVLMLALSELLVRGAERIALMGLMPPTASRKATTLMAEAIASHENDPKVRASLPPPVTLDRFSACVLFGDFLDPPETIANRLNILADKGVSGHIVQILDPAEETLPYEGRAEFLSPEGSERMLADRVESLRERYQERLLAHRDEVAAHARRLGWSFLVHHTDRTPGDALLALYMRVAGVAGDYRWGAPVGAESASSKTGGAA